MTRPRVLLAGPLSADALERLRAAAEVIVAPDVKESTLCTLVADCEALIARSNVPVTARVIAAGAKLRVIGIPAVGTDNVDEAAAAARGIPVEHAPDASSEAVAELTALLLLSLLRPVADYMGAYRGGAFAATREAARGTELRDLAIGIIGMGRIGSRAARIFAAGFGARVCYFDIEPVGPFDFPVERCASVEELVRKSDVISLHVPLTPHTRGLVSFELLGRARPGARLLNTSRGAVVDTNALVAALQSGRLAGAGLDVTDPEPLAPDHALWSLPNVVLTPHIGARTPGALARMMAVVDRVIARLQRS